MTPPTSAASGFWRTLFHSFHKLNRRPEPESFRDYKTVRLAIYELRHRTGMTLEQLAFRLGMIPSSLSNLELYDRGLLSQTHSLICKEIALDFDYPILAEFFDHQSLVSARTTRRRRNVPTTDRVEHDTDSGSM